MAGDGRTGDDPSRTRGLLLVAVTDSSATAHTNENIKQFE